MQKEQQIAVRQRHQLMPVSLEPMPFMAAKKGSLDDPS
jgi:hypothetical protein